MSAPKPRVHWDALHQRWATQCDGCRIKGWETSWSATLAMAVEHSRTHTAERVADQLDEWAGRSTDSSSGGAYWEGYLEGAALAQRDAALLVRRYLVGGAS